MSTSEKDLVTVRRQYLRHKWTACSSTDERSMFIERLGGGREGGNEGVEKGREREKKVDCIGGGGCPPGLTKQLGNEGQCQS